MFILRTDKMAVPLVQTAIGNMGGPVTTHIFQQHPPSPSIDMSFYISCVRPVDAVRREACCGATQQRRQSGAEAPALLNEISSRIVVTSDCSAGKLSSCCSKSHCHVYFRKRLTPSPHLATVIVTLFK